MNVRSSISDKENKLQICLKYNIIRILLHYQYQFYNDTYIELEQQVLKLCTIESFLFYQVCAILTLLVLRYK